MPKACKLVWVEFRGKRYLTCHICDTPKPIDEFYNRHKSQYINPRCKDCLHKTRTDKVNSSFESFIGQRVALLKNRSKKLGVPFNLDKRFLVEMYKKQDGLCFYTGEPMVLKFGDGKNRHALSVDRVVPKLGYTKDNVVLCSNLINTLKGTLKLSEIKKWLPSWYERLDAEFGSMVRYLEDCENKVATE
jgi:hypothetical protein